MWVKLAERKQFQEEYTHEKFKEVQAEFRAKMNYVTSLNIVEGNFAIYHLLEEMLFGDRRKDCILKVSFDHDSYDVSCEYSLFEFIDIVCLHVLSVCA